MKKSTFTLLLALLFLVQGIAQQVEQQQRSLITKRTASWCTFCGTWGWTFFESAIAQNDDKAVLMAAHFSGLLLNDAAAEITDNFGSFAQPRFFFNEADQGVNSSNGTSRLASLKALVDEAYGQAPIVNSGFEPYYSNGEIKVNAKVKFFQAAQGDYHLGIYLLEDNVVGFQQSIGNNAVHKRVLRTSFTEQTFGQPITNGSVNAGQEFGLNFGLPIGDPTGYNYEVVGIIWKKEGTKYIPVNVWSTKTISMVSGILDPAPENSIAVAPSPASGFTFVHVESIDNQPVAQLEVFDVKGRRVAVLLDGPLKAGRSRFRLDSEVLSGSGLYIVQLKTPGFVKTEKVVFQ